MSFPGIPLGCQPVRSMSDYDTRFGQDATEPPNEHEPPPYCTAAKRKEITAWLNSSPYVSNWQLDRVALFAAEFAALLTKLAEEKTADGHSTSTTSQKQEARDD